MAGITPQSPVIGVYAIPPYAREATVVWPSAIGAAVLIIMGFNGVLISMHIFTSSVVPSNILARDYVSIPDGARWWGLVMVGDPDPPILQNADRPRVIWRLDV